ncbi:MAG: hypothetical protein OXO50_05930 [Caldilineaceae bacterium]|nr:hypothetical protein [Caldilineaceae bacterium]
MRFPLRPRRAALIVIAASLLLLAAVGIVQARYDALPLSDELEDLWAAVDELMYLFDEVYFIEEAVVELEDTVAELVDTTDEAYGMADEAWAIADLTYEEVSALATRVAVIEVVLGIPPTPTPTPTATPVPAPTPTPIPDAVFERIFQVITCDKGETRPGPFPMIGPRITGETEVSLTERQRLFPHASGLVNSDALLLGCDVSSFVAHDDAVKIYLYLLHEIRQVCGTDAELLEAVVVTKTAATMWRDGLQRRALSGFEEEVPFMPNGQILVTYAAAARDEGVCPSTE